MKITVFQKMLHKKLRGMRVSAKMEGLPRVCQRTEICGGGLVRFGQHVHVGYRPSPGFRTTEAYFEARTPESVIDIGDNCVFNNGAKVISVKRVSIGANSVFGTDFRCYDSDFHGLRIADRNNPTAIRSAPIEIGADCWCGDCVTILKGVVLGRGCVVGAGSVVTRSFPANSLIAGNPARLVREIEQ